MEHGPGSADQVRERHAVTTGRQGRVSQCRAGGAAADVGVTDGGLFTVRAGERDLPGAKRPVGSRDLRRRLLAGEPAEVRAADADARQDPAFVLLAPGVQDTRADAGGEEEAQDERDTEPEGERPSAARPCRGLAVERGGREGRDRRRHRGRARHSAASAPGPCRPRAERSRGRPATGRRPRRVRRVGRARRARDRRRASRRRAWRRWQPASAVESGKSVISRSWAVGRGRACSWRPRHSRL